MIGAREYRTQERLRVLLVDDEPRVLDALSRTLRRHYTVSTATSGADALGALSGDFSFAAIVSDMRMPGMDGATFLQQARIVAPDAVRILLTGQADVGAAMAAVNDGGIFRFLQKPCAPELLEVSLAAACERHRAIVSERAVLRDTLTGSIAVMTDVLALASPVAFSRALRLQRSVLAMAEVLGITDRWAIELAAMLSQLGAVTVASSVLEHWYRGVPLDESDRAAVAGIERITDQLIRHIPRLERVREILAHQSTPFDGRGFAPGVLRGDALPIGARVFRVAVDYDLLISAGETPEESISTLRGRHGAYDPTVLAALCEITGNDDSLDEIREMRLVEVRPGMIFARDVVATNGLVLIGRGQEVSESLLHRIRNNWLDLPLRQLPQMIVSQAPTPDAGTS